MGLGPEGNSFTEEELKDFINSKDLSEDDLKAVAGGSTDSFARRVG
jgi:hypothetical protein